MATMTDGESYLGKILIRPLTQLGDVTLYLWPLRCLNNKGGGPTFGVNVKTEEILRYDVHGPRGHWHKGGYDKLGIRGSLQKFPEDLEGIESQLSWSLTHLGEQVQPLLVEAGYPDEAGRLDKEMVQAALDALVARLEEQGDLRSRAIELGLITA